MGRDFPYTARTTCYIEVHEDGRVTHGDDRAAYERAVAGKSRLFAVWPGEWSSHLFVIDDLDEYAKAHGIKHDQNRTGLEEHVHDVEWTEATGRNPNPRSPYISIRLKLTCGCEIRDLGTFASQMREQRRWVGQQQWPRRYVLLPARATEESGHLNACSKRSSLPKSRPRASSLRQADRKEGTYGTGISRKA